jgi:hypothetical protein
MNKGTNQVSQLYQVDADLITSLTAIKDLFCLSARDIKCIQTKTANGGACIINGVTITKSDFTPPQRANLISKLQSI